MTGRSCILLGLLSWIALCTPQTVAASGISLRQPPPPSIWHSFLDRRSFKLSPRLHFVGPAAVGGLPWDRVHLPPVELPRIPVGISPPPGTYPYIFLCTLYYTPRESGFTQEGGFDMTPETKPGLEGKQLPRDFLRAVRVEGFGRLKEPHRNMKYIKYDGRWGYKNRALGNRNNTLVERMSCAAHRRSSVLKKRSRLTTLSPLVRDVFDSIHWETADTGGGLHKWQLDLYWGEDDPRGPGRNVTRPAGTDFEYELFVPVLLGW